MQQAQCSAPGEDAACYPWSGHHPAHRNADLDICLLFLVFSIPVKGERLSGGEATAAAEQPAEVLPDLLVAPGEAQAGDELVLQGPLLDLPARGRGMFHRPFRKQLGQTACQLLVVMAIGQPRGRNAGS
jgi:hypothetical protein